MAEGFQDYGVVGTQLNRHSHESGNLERRVEETILFDKFLCGQVWIPACAGMTGFKITAFAVSGTGRGFSGKIALFYPAVEKYVFICFK